MSRPQWARKVEKKFSLLIMVIRVVEFSNVGYKITKIFARGSTYSKEIIEVWELVNGGLRNFQKSEF